MKFDILNRWSGKVQFTAEIDANELTPLPIKTGMALEWGRWNISDLTGAGLTKASLCRATLRCCNLSYTYLDFADMTGASLNGANLTGMFLFNAVLSGADLTGVDLSDASPPVIADLDVKILNALNAGGSLDMDSWQTGENTYSRGGWAIYLAGEEGKRLENMFGAHVAAGLIYSAAYPKMRVPDFYASNVEALDDMQLRAAAGAAVPRSI